ncbi:hypothetical protein BX664DRAFT_318733 [Halteromyces radiatus]|nr:hypothetical protein BX664DRAFT_318733 [Halteromyces radiatus]
MYKLRPYDRENTRSRLISAVKLVTVSSVLRLLILLAYFSERNPMSKFGAMMVIFESVTKKKVAHGTLQHILFISNNVNTWWLPFFVLFMLVMQLFYLLNMVVTSFCFIHVDDDKGIYDDQKQLVYLFELGVSFTFYSRWQQQSNEDLKNKLEQTMSR